MILPGMSGKDIAGRMVKERPDLKALYMSGYTDGIIDKHGILNFHMAFIQKPFEPAHLARKLREVLHK